MNFNVSCAIDCSKMTKKAKNVSVPAKHNYIIIGSLVIAVVWCETNIIGDLLETIIAQICSSYQIRLTVSHQTRFG